MTKTTKALLIVMAIIILAGILTFILINNSPVKGSRIVTETTVRINENTWGDAAEIVREQTLASQEQYEKMLENKDFIEVYNNFQYFQSEIIDAGFIEDNDALFYMVFSTGDAFEKIDQFYKNKKIQSIWSRTEIFETAGKKLEENFIDSEKEIAEKDFNDFKFSKYSFISQNKDRYLNVLLKSLSDDNTQIMLISWNLDS